MEHSHPTMRAWAAKRMNTLKEAEEKRTLVQDDLLLAPADPRTGVMVVRPPQSYTWQPDTRPVAPCIHQVWLGPRAVPELSVMRQYAEKQGWTHRLWTERDFTELRALGMPALWQAVDVNLKRKCWRGASNIIRYFVLFFHGGVYFDCDFVPRAETPPLAAIIPLVGFTAAPEARAREIGGNGSIFLENSFIAAPKNHVVLLRCLDSIPENTKAVIERWSGESLVSSGPFLLNKCLGGSFTVLHIDDLYRAFHRRNDNTT